jgi:hypothetical protein
VANTHSRHLEVAIKFGKRAEQMLFDFVNTIPDAAGFSRFKSKWERFGLKWDGTENNFRQAQEVIRKTWEGRKKGLEGHLVEMSLGLAGGTEDEASSAAPIHADWNDSSLIVAPRNLRDLIWLTLLQYSQRLGVCENHVKSGACPTPYFLKYRPAARFCSDACSLTAQRESKRKWWKEHGQEWLEKNRSKKSSSVRRRGE